MQTLTEFTEIWRFACN